METNESKEEIKLLGNKRKIEHENIGGKDEEKNKKNKLSEHQYDNKNDIINNSVQKNQEIKKEEKLKEMEVGDIQTEEICQKCGLKNKIFKFKKGEDIYNYLLINNLQIKDDIRKIIEEINKYIGFNKDKKICSSCIEELIKDKDAFNKFFFEKKEINPNNKNIYENNINKNIEINTEYQRILETQNINIIDNKSKEQKITNLFKLTNEQDNKNQNNINNLMNQNQNISNVIYSNNKSPQNQNNPNINPYINQHLQNNNNIPLNTLDTQHLDILSQNFQNINNIPTIQNMSNIYNNININNNPQNINNNTNKNNNAQIPYQFLLKDPSLNFNLTYIDLYAY